MFGFLVVVIALIISWIVINNFNNSKQKRRMNCSPVAPAPVPDAPVVSQPPVITT